MGVQLAESAIDLGIVVSNGPRALAFYCDLIGLEHIADMPMPIGGGGTMHRVQCGDWLLKLVAFDETPPAASGGGIPGALGLRYLTLIVSNLDEVLALCVGADVTVVAPTAPIFGQVFVSASSRTRTGTWSSSSKRPDQTAARQAPATAAAASFAAEVSW